MNEFNFHMKWKYSMKFSTWIGNIRWNFSHEMEIFDENSPQCAAGRFNWKSSQPKWLHHRHILWHEGSPEMVFWKSFHKRFLKKLLVKFLWSRVHYITSMQLYVLNLHDWYEHHQNTFYIKKMHNRNKEHHKSRIIELFLKKIENSFITMVRAHKISI